MLLTIVILLEFNRNKKKEVFYLKTFSLYILPLMSFKIKSKNIPRIKFTRLKLIRTTPPKKIAYYILPSVLYTFKNFIFCFSVMGIFPCTFILKNNIT